MDIRITKKRLNDHLSYDWWKYLAILVACIFFWSLLFTMTAPRLADGKKFEIYFIVNGFDTEKSKQAVNRLKEKLSPEIVEVNFYSYVPDDTTTVQVLSARISVKEGDMYAFTYSDTPADNSFGSYIDQGLFKDIETAVNEGIAYGSAEITLEQFKAANSSNKKLNTEEKMLAAYNEEIAARARAKEQAEKLDGYITLYPQLFYSYRKFTVSNSLITQEDEKYTLDESKIWGLDFSAFRTNITNRESYGFMYDTGTNSETGQPNPFTIAIGITSFKDNNMPYYYESIAALNYFIETYYPQAA